MSAPESQTQIDQPGRDNPCEGHILGQFPSSSINSLLSLEDVTASMQREPEEHLYRWSQKRLGVDVARFGDDRTTLCPRQGLRAYPAVILRRAKTEEIGSRILAGQHKWGAEMIFVDATGGYGAGVIDWLGVAGHTVLGVEYSGKPNDPKFYNKRAEIGWGLAEWVKTGGALPNDPSLPKEFTKLTYTFKDGKILLEPKEVMKKRLGYSPDLWDGYANTFAIPDQPGEQAMAQALMGQRKAQKMQTMDDLEA
jgi:hypothetical protein